MSLVSCRECKAEVSEYADVCPKCGISTPGQVRIWTGVVKRALIVAFAGYLIYVIAVSIGP